MEFIHEHTVHDDKGRVFTLEFSFTPNDMMNSDLIEQGIEKIFRKNMSLIKRGTLKSYYIRYEWDQMSQCFKTIYKKKVKT